MGTQGHLFGTGRGLALLSVVCILALSSCSSNQPTLSGFGLGNLRVVGVDDLVTLTVPLAEGGGRAWRVESYDSFYLIVAEPPRFVRSDSGPGSIVMRARARQAGETEIRIIETDAPADRAAEVITFSVRIVP